MRLVLGAGLVALVGAGAACGSSASAPDPGRVTLHRLNNAEYNNTVRDLLGTELRPADDFPTDDRAYGFDTVADVLRVSALGLELYETAARNLIDDTLATDVAAVTVTQEIMSSPDIGGALGDGWLLFSAGTATAEFTAPGPGRYTIAVRAYQQAAGPDAAILTIGRAGDVAAQFPVTALIDAPEIYTTDITVAAAGPLQVEVGFANDFFDQATSADRNLWLDYVELRGPFDGPDVDEGRRAAVLVCSALGTTACQDEILTRFATRAWRRPITAPELATLRGLVQAAVAADDTPEAGLRQALQAILISPHFLYRVEIDPTPTDRAPHPLGAHELASRLSYFLWSSMPDDELFAAAQSGALLDPGELDRQARRMLDDPKADALLDDFFGQWLFTRALGSQDPDYTLFPDYDDELEASMRAETRAFVRAFLGQGGIPGTPMTEFLTADFTFVDDRLAAFYGLPPVGSTEPVRVSLADSPRRGFLMQGSFLRVTSRPKRTSPVLRGKWVLDNLLCSPPPPPPPGVEGFPEAGPTSGTMRERLIAHQQNPVCASCHTAMDPIGFGLDEFDAIGRHRTTDAGQPIDSSGTLFGAVPFTNARELVAGLAAQPNVYRCMVEKLYTYTGRPPLRVEALEHIEELTRGFVESGYDLRELIVATATHPSFTQRRGEP